MPHVSTCSYFQRKKESYYLQIQLQHLVLCSLLSAYRLNGLSPQVRSNGTISLEDRLRSLLSSPNPGGHEGEVRALKMCASYHTGCI